LLPPPAFGIPALGAGTFDNLVGAHCFTNGGFLVAMLSPSVLPFTPMAIPLGVLAMIGDPFGCSVPRTRLGL
jgi:hypothetical protein